MSAPDIRPKNLSLGSCLYLVGGCLPVLILAQSLDFEGQRRYHAGIMLQFATFFSFYFYFAGPPQPQSAEEDRLP